MKKILISAIVSLAPLFAVAQDFYGTPVHPSATKKEIRDGGKDQPYASMRYISKIKPQEMRAFYKSKLPKPFKEEEITGTIIFSYKVGEHSKMVTIEDFLGASDVTIGTQK